MRKTVLITGGTGLIGKRLTRFFLKHGYKVNLLARNAGEHGNPHVRVFKWDVYKREIDPDCLESAVAIIHLAGESITEKRWNEKRKTQLIESRTASIKLIYDLIRNSGNTSITTVISASATGFYGDRGDEILTEESTPGAGFLSEICVAWENAADEGLTLGLRVVKLRTGIVLSDEGGALEQIAGAVKLNLGAALGSGRQWLSWIHVNDAIRMYRFALENEDLTGVFNMVAPEPLTNIVFTKAIALEFGKKLWLPNVPEFALRLALGERSAILLDSNRASADKILKAGFEFEYPALTPALYNLYG